MMTRYIRRIGRKSVSVRSSASCVAFCAASFVELVYASRPQKGNDRGGHDPRRDYSEHAPEVAPDNVPSFDLVALD